MSETQTIEISQEVYKALMAEVELRGMTIEEFLKSFLLQITNQIEQSDKTIGERLERKGLIGSIDSSIPDPSSPPIHSPFGQLLIEKFRKQGLNFP